MQVAHRHPRYLGIFLDLQSHFVKRRPGIFCHRIHIQCFQTLSDHAAYQIGTGDFPPELDIFRHGESGNQHKFLMDHADTQLHGFLRRIDIHSNSVHLYRPRKTTGGMDHGHPKQNIHQGGFPGPIFAHQRMDFSRIYLEFYPLEHSVSKVFLDDILHV